MNRSRGRNRQGYRTVVQRTGSIDKRTDNAADDNNHQRSNSGARFNNDGGFYKPFQPFQNDNYSNTSQNNFQTHQPGQYGQRSYSKPTNGMSGTSQFHNRQNFQPQNNEIPSILDLKVGAPVQPYRRVMQENGSTRGRGNGSQRFNRRGRNNYHGSRSPNDLRPSQLQLSNSGRQDLINKEAPRRPVRTSTENILGHGEEPGNINKARDLMEEEYKIQAAECAAKCREAELKKLQEKMMKLRFVSNFDTGYRFPVGPTVDNPKEREFRIQKLQESYNEQSREYQKELQKIEERKKALEEERRIERINSKDYDHIMLGVRLGSNPQTFFPENRGAIPKQGRHITSHKRKPVQSSKPVKDKNKKIKFSSIQGDLSIIQSIYAEPEPEPEVSSTKDISIQEVREQMQEQYNKKVVQDLVKEYDKESFVPNSEDNELRIARLKMQKAYDHRAVQEKSEKVKEKSTDEVKPINSGQGVDKVKENSQTDNKLKPSEGNKNKKSNAPHNMSKTPQTGASLPSPSHNINKTASNSSNKSTEVIQSPPQSSAGSTNNKSCPLDVNSASQSFKIAPQKADAQLKINEVPQTLVGLPSPIQNMNKTVSTSSNAQVLHSLPQNGAGTTNDRSKTMDISAASQNEIRPQKPYAAQHNTKKGLHTEGLPPSNQNMNKRANTNSIQAAQSFLQNGAGDTNNRSNTITAISQTTSISAVSQNEVEPKKPNKNLVKRNVNKVPQNWEGLPSPNKNINNSTSFTTNNQAIQSPSNNTVTTNQESDLPNATQNKVAPKKSSAQQRIMEVLKNSVGLPLPNENMLKTGSISSNKETESPPPQNSVMTANNRNNTTVNTASQNKVGTQKNQNAESLDKAIDVLTSMENLEKYRKNLHSKRLDCIKSEMDELFSFIEKEKSSSQPIKEGKEAKELSYQEQLRQRALVMDKKYGAENAPKPSSTNVLPLHSEAPKQCSPATRSLRSVAQQPSSAARNINEQSLIRLLNLRELNHYDRTGLVPMKGGYYVDVKHCFTTNGVDKLGQPILQLRVK
uniref:Uncharacterized protein n=1 Tax=Clastoptera arizonana TaxID=38151 RepID=A0A1B6EBX5_9HEMI